MDKPLDTDSLLDAIAAITSRRESGRLQITAQGSRGAFFFKEGKLVDARMGPFSGFPAVNQAMALGKADLKFDPTIQPPHATLISIKERILLKERFGIEAEAPTAETDTGELRISGVTKVALQEIKSDKHPVPTGGPVPLPETESEEQPGPTGPQVPLPEKTIPAQADASHEPAQQAEGVINKAQLRESNLGARRTRAQPKESQRLLTANRFLKLETEDASRKIEGENSATTSPSITLESTRTAKAGDTARKSIDEAEKPWEPSGQPLIPGAGIHPEQVRASGSGSKTSLIQTGGGAGTKRCPKCNRVYEDFRIYCPDDSSQLISESEISFSDPAKTEAGGRHVSLWTFVAISLVVGGILGYFLNSYLSWQPNAPATSIETQSEPNLSENDDQPLVEGFLQGKEIDLIKPEYSAMAKREGVSGKVTVAIRVNKKGRVVSARALTGPRLLRVASVAAARQSRFAPESLENRSSKNSGTITYTFK